MKNRVAVIQIACGFREEPLYPHHFAALSQVDDKRAEEARRLYVESIHRGSHVELWTTGQVGWERMEYTFTTITLASLNQRRALQELGPKTLTRQVPGLNAFSESWNACMIARDNDFDEIIVVSSAFYLAAYQSMWEAAAWRNGLDIKFGVVRHEDGVVSEGVKNFYLGFLPQTLARVAASSALAHWLVMKLVDLKTRDRITRGFKIDGHTTIS